MINKILGVSPPVKPDKTKKKHRTKKDAPVAADPEKQSQLHELVLNSIDFSTLEGDVELRRTLIFNTLKQAFGDKVVAEPQFKALIDRIDNMVSDDPIAKEQINAIKKSHLSKR